MIIFNISHTRGRPWLVIEMKNYKKNLILNWGLVSYEANGAKKEANIESYSSR